jgi:hypothetical protein
VGNLSHLVTPPCVHSGLLLIPINWKVNTRQLASHFVCTHFYHNKGYCRTLEKAMILTFHSPHWTIGMLTLVMAILVSLAINIVERDVPSIEYPSSILSPVLLSGNEIRHTRDTGPLSFEMNTRHAFSRRQATRSISGVL